MMNEYDYKILKETMKTIIRKEHNEYIKKALNKELDETERFLLKKIIHLQKQTEVLRSLLKEGKLIEENVRDLKAGCFREGSTLRLKNHIQPKGLTYHYELIECLFQKNIGMRYMKLMNILFFGRNRGFTPDFQKKTWRQTDGIMDWLQANHSSLI
jgi:hypothetical protein